MARLQKMATLLAYQVLQIDHHFLHAAEPQIAFSSEEIRREQSPITEPQCLLS
jgi:hypothetical protein